MRKMTASLYHMVQRPFTDTCVVDVPLFHGSAIPSIRNFKPAERCTFGLGVYCTSERGAAERYAILRQRTEYSGEVPFHTPLEAVVYEFAFTGNVLDLQTTEGIAKVFPNWQRYLVENREAIAEQVSQWAAPQWKDVMRDLIIYEIERKAGAPKIMNRNTLIGSGSLLNRIFSDYLCQQGFDGIIGEEGGERDGDLQIGTHDTWVIFDPEKLRFVDEYRIKDKGGEQQ